MIHVLEPYQEPNLVEKDRLAPRLDSLRGMVLGVLDNRKPNADKLLRAMAERFESRYGVARSVYLQKEPKYSDHVTEEEQAKLAGCDFIITGTGD